MVRQHTESVQAAAVLLAGARLRAPPTRPAESGLRAWQHWVWLGAVLLGAAAGVLAAEPDADGDGLPDTWEQRLIDALPDDALATIADVRPDDDFDGDGGRNAEEFFWTTDPCLAQAKLVLDWADAVARLRVIGRALAEYQEDHGADVLPPRLLSLVNDGYLDAAMLVCRADPTAGAEGGLPDVWTWHPAAGQQEEAGVSFLYEFSAAPYPWGGPGATWYSLKLRQLREGDDRQPYDPRVFPMVRCFWLEYPKYLTNTRVAQGVAATTLNLAFDCQSVFASEQYWEPQSSGRTPDDPPELRDLVAPGPVPTAGRGEALEFPLWVKVRDVGTVSFGLGSGPAGANPGEVSGCLYRLTPDGTTPMVLPVTAIVSQGAAEALRSEILVYVRGAGVIHVSAAATGASDGTTWADAYTDLQAALAMAAATATAEHPVQVWVAAGTYRPTSWPGGGSAEREKHFALNANVTLYGGFAASGNPTLAERFPAAFPTVLSGDIGVPGDAADNCYHVLYNAVSVQPGLSPVLDGVTLTGGNADAAAAPHDRGGGVFADIVGLTLVGCVLTGNAATYGGGLCSETPVTLVNCILAGNAAAHGGGVCCWYDSPTLVNCTLTGNAATIAGGAIDGVGSPTPTVTNCVLWDNGAAVAGVALDRFTYNLIDLDDVSALPASNRNDDPLFANAASPAGADGRWGTDDDGLRPGPGSPCIDSGDNGAVPATAAADITGAARIQALVVDLGAYEQCAKAGQTIAFAALPAATYGDGPLTLAATASSGLAVELATDGPAVATVAGGTVTLVGAGTCQITASQPGDGNWNAAPPVVQTLVVAPAALTVTAMAAERCAGQSNPAFGCNVSGLRNGDTLASIGLTPMFACAANELSPPGDYDIVPSGPAHTADYVVAYVTGTLHVVDATLPWVTSSAPPNGATNVDLGAALRLTFSEDIQAGTGAVCIMNADGSLFESLVVGSRGSVAVSGPHVTLTHAPLQAGSRYHVLIGPTCFRDLAGNAFAGNADPAAWTFTARPWLVAFVAGAHGSLAGDTVQMVSQGGSAAVVSAVADYGYVFEQWSDGSTAPVRTLTDVGADLVLTASFRAAAGVAPDGEFLLRAAADAVAAGGGIWDLTGSYAAVVGGAPLTLALTHDADGRVRGKATLAVADGAGAGWVDLAVKGRVRGGADAISVRLDLKGADTPRGASVALSCRLGLDAGSRQLTGTVSGQVATAGRRTKVSEGMAVDLPAAMDGTWTVSLVLTPRGNTVGGPALLTLANGVRHHLTATGKATASAAELTLVASRLDPAAAGLRMRLGLGTLEGAWARLDQVGGKAYGQTLGQSPAGSGSGEPAGRTR